MEISRTLEASLAFVAVRQRTDGGFDCLAGPKKGHGFAGQPCPAIFVAALIGQCLRDIPAAVPVTRSLADYLLRQRSPDWTWNYWERGRAADRPQYPDDLDDTACAAAVIAATRPERLDGAAYGCLTRALVAAEAAPGGPYHTWLVPEGLAARWDETDPAVNANIASLLQQLRALPDGLRLYMQRVAAEGTTTSAYYPEPLVMSYLLARTGVMSDQPSLLARLDGSRILGTVNDSDLLAALALSSRCRLGLRGAVTDTLAGQLVRAASLHDWRAEPFYAEAYIHGRPMLAGSDALTAAAVAEALYLYTVIRTPVVVPAAAPRVAPLALYGSMSRTAAAITGHELRLGYRRLLHDIERRDRDGQIGSLAARLAEDIGRPVPAGTVRKLCAASVNGWLAYTAYDDVLDGSGPVGLINPANWALRESVRLFESALPDISGWSGLVHDSLQRVDAANAWEQAHARAGTAAGKLVVRRLPDYGALTQLADRSWGHSLATQGVLLAAGFEADSPQVAAWSRYMRHYLIARQLHDDAHDWTDDLAAGHLTAVISRLLRDVAIPCEPTGPELTAKLRQHYWREVLPWACGVITDHLNRAEAALADCPFLSSVSAYRQPLARLRAGAQQADRERKQAMAFVRAYQGG